MPQPIHERGLVHCRYLPHVLLLDSGDTILNRSVLERSFVLRPRNSERLTDVAHEEVLLLVRPSQRVSRSGGLHQRADPSRFSSPPPLRRGRAGRGCPAGQLTRGFAQDALTKSSTHPHGIKVRLETSEIGRVKEILSEESGRTSGRGAERASRKLQNMMCGVCTDSGPRFDGRWVRFGSLITSCGIPCVLPNRPSRPATGVEQSA